MYIYVCVCVYIQQSGPSVLPRWGKPLCPKKEQTTERGYYKLETSEGVDT